MPYRQVERHRILIPRCVGSNPTMAVKYYIILKFNEEMGFNIILEITKNEAKYLQSHGCKYKCETSCADLFASVKHSDKKYYAYETIKVVNLLKQYKREIIIATIINYKDNGVQNLISLSYKNYLSKVKRISKERDNK